MSTCKTCAHARFQFTPRGNLAGTKPGTCTEQEVTIWTESGHGCPLYKRAVALANDPLVDPDQK